jgi:hypothetical protein
MRLSRNAWNIPEVFYPHPNGSLVVSERIARELSATQGIALVPVLFRKVFYHEFSSGVSLRGAPAFSGVTPEDTPESILDQLPDYNPGINGKFFEVVTEVLQLISDRYKYTQRIYYYRRSMRDLQRCELQLSKEIMQDYPMLWAGPVLMTETIYELLQPHLDADYFHIRELQIP